MISSNTVRFNSRVMKGHLPGKDPLNTSLRCFICRGLGVPRLAELVSEVGPDLFNWDVDEEDPGKRFTTVLTLEPLGVGDSGFWS